MPPARKPRFVRTKQFLKKNGIRITAATLGGVALVGGYKAIRHVEKKAQEHWRLQAEKRLWDYAQLGKKEGDAFVPKVRSEAQRLSKKYPKMRGEIDQYNEHKKYLETIYAGDPQLKDRMEYFEKEYASWNTYMRPYYFEAVQRSERVEFAGDEEALYFAGKSRGEALAIVYLYLRATGETEQNAWGGSQWRVEQLYDPVAKADRKKREF